MSTPDTEPQAEIVITEAMISDAARLIGSLPREVAISDDDLRTALAGLIRVFGVRAEENPNLLPFPEGHDVTATEAMISVSAILRALNLQLFELGMWQSWTGRH
jgi:hypothetical protein